MSVKVTVEELLAHCEVDSRLLGEEVTSEYYHQLSPHLSQWKNVAPKLRFTDDEVESIDNDNTKAEAKRVSFLKTWKQKFAMKATYKALIQSLLNIERVEDARGVCLVVKSIQKERTENVNSKSARYTKQ